MVLRFRSRVWWLAPQLENLKSFMIHIVRRLEAETLPNEAKKPSLGS